MSEAGNDASHEKTDQTFRSVALNAIIATRLEKDRQLLAQSSAGIALIVTLMTTVGVSSTLSGVLYAFSIVCFGFTIWSAIEIFDVNGTYLQAGLDKETKKETDEETRAKEKLDCLDRRIKWLFIAGAIFLVAGGLTSAVDNYTTKQIMSDKQDKSQNGNRGSSQRTDKSFSGFNTNNQSSSSAGTSSSSGNSSESSSSGNSGSSGSGGSSD